jgi:hypothetical protein
MRGQHDWLAHPKVTVMMRFNVFGKLIGVERTPTGWATLFLGDDGKRRPGDFIVPDFIAEDEVAEYLRDLFHESASPHNPDVKRLA